MAIPIWTVLGAMTGIGLTPLTRHFLIQKHRLVSWVWLGIATAILFGLMAWRMPTWPDLFIYSAFVAFGVATSVVDIAEHRLPTRLVLPAYPVTLLLAAILQRGDLGSLARVALGMLVLPGFYLVLALISRGGIGAGDVRLAGPVGGMMAWQGCTTLAAGTLLAFVFGSIAGLVMIVSRSATRHTPIPFGPAIIAGALTAIIIRGA